MLEAVAGTVLVMLLYAVVEEEAPRFCKWLIFRRFIKANRRTARAFESMAESARRFGETLERVFDGAFEAACAHDPGLAVALWNARLTDPDVGWLDVVAERAEAGR